MKSINKFFYIIYLIPYSYIALILDYFGKKSPIYSFIMILGYLSVLTPIFVVKFYKNSLLGILFIILGNFINSGISFILIKFFTNYTEYDYYFKPFGMLRLSVFLTILSLILQIITYILIYTKNKYLK